jgi:hypothetical protein
MGMTGAMKLAMGGMPLRLYFGEKAATREKSCVLSHFNITATRWDMFRGWWWLTMNGGDAGMLVTV